MRTFRKIALAGILAALSSAAAQAQQCQLKQIASFDMVENPYGLILISLQLSGTPQPMVLDTGAFNGMLAADVGDLLKLDHHTLSQTALIYTAGGGKFDRYMIVPTVSFGPVTANEVQFLEFDRSREPAKIIAGSFGQDLLRNFDVELDFAKNKVNFFSPDHCPGKVVYWSRDSVAIPMKLSDQKQIELETNLDGHVVDTILDTGTTRTSLNLRIAHRIFGIDETSPNVRHVGGDAYVANFQNLSFQGLSVPNPTINLLPDKILERAKEDIPDKEQNLPGTEIPHLPELILGMDVIRQLHIYIAYGEHMLYVTPAQ